MTSLDLPTAASNGTRRALTLRDRAVDELRCFLEAHPVTKGLEADEFRRFEETVADKLAQVQRLILGDAMAAADVDADAIEVEGRVLRRTLRSSQTYMTSAEPVEVERCSTGIAPTPRRTLWPRWTSSWASSRASGPSTRRSRLRGW